MRKAEKREPALLINEGVTGAGEESTWSVDARYGLQLRGLEDITDILSYLSTPNLCE